MKTQIQFSCEILLNKITMTIQKYELSLNNAINVQSNVLQTHLIRKFTER